MDRGKVKISFKYNSNIEFFTFVILTCPWNCLKSPPLNFAKNQSTVPIRNSLKRVNQRRKGVHVEILYLAVIQLSVFPFRHLRSTRSQLNGLRYRHIPFSHCLLIVGSRTIKPVISGIVKVMAEHRALALKGGNYSCRETESKGKKSTVDRMIKVFFYCFLFVLLSLSAFVFPFGSSFCLFSQFKVGKIRWTNKVTVKYC